MDQCGGGTATCNSRLEGTGASPTHSTWGPEVDWPESGNTLIANVNIGGCIIEQYGTSADTCGHDFENLSECEHQVCDTSCGAAIGDFNDCATNADKGACLTYSNAVNSDCAAYTASSCWPGASATFDSVLVAAGETFCD